MRNLSVMEQKQVVGGGWLVKAYYWDSGLEDKNKRRFFDTPEEAWYYYSYLSNNYGDIYHVLQPQERK